MQEYIGQGEMSSVRSDMVSKMGSMLQFEEIHTTVVHHRAMLRLHEENGYKLSPDQSHPTWRSPE